MAVDTKELAQRLAEEGCNPALYTIGSRGVASDAYCLVENYGRWTVFYTERGTDSPPIYSGSDEAQACEFFFRKVMSLRHEHCVGFFRKEDRARALRAELASHGLDSYQDKIPFGGPHDPRFRVFVRGKAIFKAREVLAGIPVRD